MKSHVSVALAFVIGVMAVVLTSTPAGAYGGPGSVITGIGALLAVVAALIASIFGFLWFPLKRFVRKVRGSQAEIDAKRSSASLRKDAGGG